MISKIDEIKKALENNMPHCALALTLTLPDICSQIEFHSENGCRRLYIDWLNQNIPSDAFCNDFIETNTGNDILGFPKIDNKAIYKLRCEFLHSGDAEIEKYSNVSQDNYLDEFIFTEIGEMDWTDEKGYGVKSGYSSYIEKDNPDGLIKRTYRIDLKYFCEVICEAARKYYDNCSNKELFRNHSVIFRKI